MEDNKAAAAALAKLKATASQDFTDKTTAYNNAKDEIKRREKEAYESQDESIRSAAHGRIQELIKQFTLGPWWEGEKKKISYKRKLEAAEKLKAEIEIAERKQAEAEKKRAEEALRLENEMRRTEEEKKKAERKKSDARLMPPPTRVPSGQSDVPPTSVNPRAVPPLDRSILLSSKGPAINTSGSALTVAAPVAPLTAITSRLAPLTTPAPAAPANTAALAVAAPSRLAMRPLTSSSETAVNLDSILSKDKSRSSSPDSRGGSDSAVNRPGEEYGEPILRLDRTPSNLSRNNSPLRASGSQAGSQGVPKTPTKSTGGSALTTPNKPRRITSTYSHTKKLPNIKILRHADELESELDPSNLKSPDNLAAADLSRSTMGKENARVDAPEIKNTTDSQRLSHPIAGAGDPANNVSVQGRNERGVQAPVSGPVMEPIFGGMIEAVETDEQKRLERTDKRVELDTVHSSPASAVYKGSAFNENMRSWDKSERNFHREMSKFLIPPKITISVEEVDALVSLLPVSDVERAAKKADYLKFINCEVDRQASLILLIVHMPSPQKEEFIQLLPEKKDLLAKYENMSEEQKTELRELVGLNERAHQKELIDKLVVLPEEQREQYLEFLQLSNWDLISLYLTEEQRTEFATLISFYHELVQTPSLFHTCAQYSEINRSSAENDEKIDMERINHLYELICETHQIEAFVTTVALITGFSKNERIEEAKKSITERLTAIHERSNDNDALKFLKKTFGYNVKFSPLLLKRITVNPAYYLSSTLIEPIQILSKRGLCIKEALKKAPANKVLLVRGNPLLAKNGRKVRLRKRVSDISHRLAIYGQKVNRVERIHNFDHDAAKLKTVIQNYIKRKHVSRYLTSNHLFAIAKVMSLINCYRKTGVGDRVIDRLNIAGTTNKATSNEIRKKIDLEKTEYDIHLETLQKLVERWYISHRLSLQIEAPSFEKLLAEITSIIKATAPDSVLHKSLEILLPELEALNPSRLSRSGVAPKSPEAAKPSGESIISKSDSLNTTAFKAEVYQPVNMFIWEDLSEQEGNQYTEEELKSKCNHFIRISIIEHVLKQFLQYDFIAAKKLFKPAVDATQQINHKIITKLAELKKASPETLDKICENISIRDLLINVISNEISMSGEIPEFVLKGPFQETVTNAYKILNEMVLETEQARSAAELFVPNPLIQSAVTDSPTETWVTLLANTVNLRNFYTRALPLGDKVAQAGFAKQHQHKHWTNLAERVAQCAEEVFLEERTDEYDFLVMSISDEYDFLVMSISEQEKIDLKIMQEISYKNDGMPILIKQGEKYFICGNSKGKEWKVTELEPAVIKGFTQSLGFPQAGAAPKIILKDELYRKIYTEITGKEGHTSDDLALNAEEAINLDQMQELSHANGDKPILIKYLNAYYIYGYSNANAEDKDHRKWKLTELNPASIGNILDTLPFPEDGACGLIKKSDSYTKNSDGSSEKLEAFSDFYIHVASKVGHTSPEKAAKNTAGLKKLIAVMEQVYFEIDDSMIYGNDGSAFKNEIGDWIAKHVSYRVPPSDGSPMRDIVVGTKRFDKFDKMFDHIEMPSDKARNIIYKHFTQKASNILLKYLIKVDHRKFEQTMLMKVSIVNAILKDLDAISKYDPQEMQKIIELQKVDDPYKNIHGLIRDIISSRILNNPIFHEGEAAEMLAELGEYCNLLPVPITEETQAISLECPVKRWHRPSSNYGISPVVAPDLASTVDAGSKRSVMQYDNPLMNPKYWYTAENINRVLQRQLIDGVDARIYAPLSPILKGEVEDEEDGSTSLIELPENDKTCMNVFQEAIKRTLADKIPSVMVIDLSEEVPVNKLKMPKNGKPTGNHWIGVVIKPNGDINKPNTVTMMIIDSEGNEFPYDDNRNPQNIEMSTPIHSNVSSIVEKFKREDNDDGERKWRRIGKLCDKLSDYKLEDDRTLLDATAKITVTGKIQQLKSNGWDCGPYAVDNLVAEVKPNFVRTSVTRSRQLHAQHIADFAAKGALSLAEVTPSVVVHAAVTLASDNIAPAGSVAPAAIPSSVPVDAKLPTQSGLLNEAPAVVDPILAALLNANVSNAQGNDQLSTSTFVLTVEPITATALPTGSPATPRSVSAISPPGTPAKQLSSLSDGQADKEQFVEVNINNETTQDIPNPFSFYVAQVLAITDCSFKTALGKELEHKEIMLKLQKSLQKILQDKLGAILDEKERQTIIADVITLAQQGKVDVRPMAIKLKKNLQSKLASYLTDDINRCIDEVVIGVANTVRNTNYCITQMTAKPEYNKHADDLVRFAVEKYIQLQEYKGELHEKCLRIRDEKKRNELKIEHEQLLIKKQNGLLEALKNKIIATETQMNEWSIFKIFFNGPTPYTLSLKELHESITNVQNGKITFEKELERESNPVTDLPRLQQLAQYNRHLFAASSTESDNYVERHVLEQVKTRAVKFERGFTGFFSSFFKLIMQRKASVTTCKELSRLSEEVSYEERTIEKNKLSRILGKPVTIRELAIHVLAGPISCGGMLVDCFTKGFFAIGLKSACRYLEHLHPKEKRQKYLHQILIPNQIDRYTRDSKMYPLEDDIYPIEKKRDAQEKIEAERKLALLNGMARLADFIRGNGLGVQLADKTGIAPFKGDASTSAQADKLAETAARLYLDKRTESVVMKDAFAMINIIMAELRKTRRKECQFIAELEALCDDFFHTVYEPQHRLDTDRKMINPQIDSKNAADYLEMSILQAAARGIAGYTNLVNDRKFITTYDPKIIEARRTGNNINDLFQLSLERRQAALWRYQEKVDLADILDKYLDEREKETPDPKILQNLKEKLDKRQREIANKEAEKLQRHLQREKDLQERQEKETRRLQLQREVEIAQASPGAMQVKDRSELPRNGASVPNASRSSTPREIIDPETFDKDDRAVSNATAKKIPSRNTTGYAKKGDFRQFTKSIMALGSAYEEGFWNLDSNPESIVKEGDLGRALRTTSSYFDRIAPKEPLSIAENLHAFFASKGDSRGQKAGTPNCRNELLMEKVPDERSDVLRARPVM